MDDTLDAPEPDYELPESQPDEDTPGTAQAQVQKRCAAPANAACSRQSLPHQLRCQAALLCKVAVLGAGVHAGVCAGAFTRLRQLPGDELAQQEAPEAGCQASTGGCRV